MGEPGFERVPAWLTRGGVLALLVITALVGWLSWSVRAVALPTAPTLAQTQAMPTSPALRALEARQLRFEPNVGQAPKAVRYLSRGPAHQLALFDDGMALAVPGRASAQLRFVNARTGGRFEEREPVAARTNYLHGPDPARWLRGVPQLRQLRYAELYRGIDLVYYSRDGELEFDLVVRPGADPAAIQLQASGEKAPFIDDAGDLLLDGKGGALRVHRPVLHQNIDGRRITLDARWVLGEAGAVSFALPAYDKRYPLVIDPVFKLLYSTYLGGVHDDLVGNLVLDAQGNAYVVGHSGSEDWPVSGNAVQSERMALGRYVRNVVVTKFDAAGTLIWSTFLGGSINDFGRAIALDSSGQVVIAGQTFSSDFPTTADALQRQLQGAANGFIAVLSPDGSTLVRSTLYGGAGGSDVTGLAFDAAGRAVVVGAAGPGLPTTAGAYQTVLASGQAAYAAKFDLTLAGAAQLAAASYYGAASRPAGQNNDNLVYGFALDAAGAPWLTGQAFTAGLPVTPDAVMAAPASLTPNCSPGSVALNSAAYIARLSADLKTLPYASYITGRTGGPATCAEFGRGVAFDAAGSMYVVGSTASLAFPTTAGALQATSPSNSGFTGYSSFVVKLAPDARTIVWSTYLGGNGGNTFASRIVPDNTANALWVQATTGGGTNFPLSADGLQQQFGGGTYDASYHQLDATTGALKYGTYMGGSGNENSATMALDAGGNAYVAGDTDSRNFVVTPTAFQPLYTPDAFDGNDWFFRVLGGATIGSVRPVTAAAGGEVSLSVRGAGFEAGVQAVLVSPAGVRTVAVASSVDTIGGQFTFAIAAGAAGAHDLELTMLDGRVLTRRGALAVGGTAAPSLSAQVLGRPKIRTGVPATYQVVVTNSGNVDAHMIPLWITVPSGVRVQMGGLDIAPAASGSWWADGATNRFSHIVATLAAGASEAVQLTITAPTNFDNIPITAALQSPWFRTLAQVRAFAQATRYGSACVADSSIPEFVDCSGLYLAYYSNGLAPLEGGDAATVSAAKTSPASVRERPLAGDDCDKKPDFFDGVNKGSQDRNAKRPFGSTHNPYDGTGNNNAWNQWQAGYAAGYAASSGPQAASRESPLAVRERLLAEAACPVPPLPPPPPTVPPASTGGGGSAGAIDPNDKYGPAGSGLPGRYLRTAMPMSYQIAFENLASAGLPAAEVVVTDQLDTAVYDLSTLTLSSITWGSHRIEVPPGLNAYSTVYNIDATISVRVAGSLNPTTGVLKWTFTTLDPATHLPPSDPTLGFLPPNVNGTQGQGYVNFTISPKAGLPEGTKWENFASIVFDANAPILTPTWVNTLDTVAPVGHVASATQRSDSTDVDVAWSATDGGSGARSYTVYVADNGGAYTAWQSAVTATTAVFSGTVGHSYGFYVIATDGAGNTEAAKSAAEASVTVRDPAAAGGGGGGGGCTVGTPGQRDASLVLLALAALILLRRRRLSARLATSWQRRARR